MNAPVYNFAYLDEQTKRMIRRAILKAIAICVCKISRAPTRASCWRWDIRRSAAMAATIRSRARSGSARSRSNSWRKMSASRCRSAR